MPATVVGCRYIAGKPWWVQSNARTTRSMAREPSPNSSQSATPTMWWPSLRMSDKFGSLLVKPPAGGAAPRQAQASLAGERRAPRGAGGAGGVAPHVVPVIEQYVRDVAGEITVLQRRERVGVGL
jgi:hypothetical protein